MKKIGALFLICLSSISFVSCGKSPNPLSGLKISRDEFDHVVIHVDIATLTANNCTLGDSLDFVFTNGYQILDVPYYDGYYGKKGDYMFVAYPSYPFPVLTIDFEPCIIDTAGLDVNKDTVSISLNKKEGYKLDQDTLSITYSNDRNEYDSDEMFANYRNIVLGDIKPDRLYRSASPCNNDANRANYVSDLMKKDNIEFVFDLSNDSTKLKEYAQKEDTPLYWKTLYNKNHVFDCKVNANYYSEDYFPKIKILCDAIIDNDGKYLFHCFEGKDRTGFLAILLEALCGATYQEIEADYFLTYQNYYRLSKESDAVKYSIFESIKFAPMIKHLTNKDVDVSKEELFSGAKNYLTKCGLSLQRINLLIDKLTK